MYQLQKGIPRSCKNNFPKNVFTFDFTAILTFVLGHTSYQQYVEITTNFEGIL